jgi:hypothetical protein
VLGNDVSSPSDVRQVSHKRRFQAILASGVCAMAIFAEFGMLSVAAPGVADEAARVRA